MHWYILFYIFDLGKYLLQLHSRKFSVQTRNHCLKSSKLISIIFFIANKPYTWTYLYLFTHFAMFLMPPLNVTHEGPTHYQSMTYLHHLPGQVQTLPSVWVTRPSRCRQRTHGPSLPMPRPRPFGCEGCVVVVV